MSLVPVLVLVMVGWLTAPRRRRWVAGRRRGLSQRRRAREVAEAVPELCGSMARRLVVGETVLVALRGAAESTVLEEEVVRVGDDHARGSTLRRAVQRWADRSGAGEVRAFAAAVALATGPVGARPELFDSIAVTLRRQRERRADAESQAAQALLSSWVIAALPWIVASAALIEGGAPADVLVGTTFGRVALATAVALEALGLLWMRRMIRSAIR